MFIYLSPGLNSNSTPERQKHTSEDFKNLRIKNIYGIIPK